jgi:DNA-binding NarL/FixJ family response regulator
MTRKIQIGVADDQLLFLKSLKEMLDRLPAFQVTVEALNGEELLRKLGLLTELPDIILVDVKMPIMGGMEAVTQISQRYPVIKLVALSMEDADAMVIGMIKAGCCSYLLKEIHPDELQCALLEIYNRGYYNADTFNRNSRRMIREEKNVLALRLSVNEEKFLHLACSDLTYKQIASQMHLSERTIDGYRESLFEKLNVQSRVGMVLEGIKKKLIILQDC